MIIFEEIIQKMPNKCAIKVIHVDTFRVRKLENLQMKILYDYL